MTPQDQTIQQSSGSAADTQTQDAPFTSPGSMPTSVEPNQPTENTAVDVGAAAVDGAQVSAPITDQSTTSGDQPT